MAVKGTIKLEIKKINRNKDVSIEDVLVIEEPLEIRLSYHTQHGIYRTISLAVTMRTPGDDISLATGFLFTEGIIVNMDDISDKTQIEDNIVLIKLKESVVYDVSQHQRNFYTTSSCGVCGKASIDSITSDTIFLPWKSQFSIKRDILFSIKTTLAEYQSNFKQTGGIHACALFDQYGELKFIKEDVGRHNAMDKLIGNHVHFPILDQIVLLSGRASFELVQKASKAGIPIVASIGAPSSLAVQLAKEQGICLIGFLKNNSFNIYSREDRVV